jgi:hypothetical protein
MKQGHTEEHWSDADGNPTGGCSYGVGFAISWQNGPLGRGATRREPNGAFVEDVLAAVIGRIEFYQNSRFACRENLEALINLREAARWLDRRTAECEQRAVEGTHTP